jgi:hypothetical protein
MAGQVQCPSCRGSLRVPSELLGQRVQCPTCEAIFVVDPPRVMAADESASPKATGERVSVDIERIPRSHYSIPHRGGLILTLGILSLVICGPLGIFAWIMGNNDLAAMRIGEMDPRGEGSTQAGRICGIIACCIMLASCLIYMVFGMAMLGARAF